MGSGGKGSEGLIAEGETVVVTTRLPKGKKKGLFGSPEKTSSRFVESDCVSFTSERTKKEYV